MRIAAKKIKIFKIKNRKGYGAICLDNLTEGKTVYQAYQRMVKALSRSKVEITSVPGDIRTLIKTL